MKKIIFLITCLSLLLLYIPEKAFASATFFFSPSSGNYKVGDEIPVTIYLNSGGQSINAAEGKVAFSSEYLDYVSNSTSGSFFNFWTTSPTAGSNSVDFGGGLATPGFNGNSGKILTVTWRAKKVGTTTVSIGSGMVLTNTEEATNIYGGGGTATFTIGETSAQTQSPSSTATTPAKPSFSVAVSSHSHPDQNKWYKDKNVKLNWSSNFNTEGYVFSFDQVSNSTPPNGPLVSVREQSYDNVTDGVWYFHIKAKTSDGFSPVAHFRLQIDTTPPDQFNVEVRQDGDKTHPQPKVFFEANDNLSGIEKYNVLVDGNIIESLKSGDALPRQKPGDHTVIVKAYDKAGNVQSSKATFHIDGITRPKVVLLSEMVGLLDPVRFVGSSSPDDTIIVYVDGKEADRFIAREKKVDSAPVSDEVLLPEAGWIIWQYNYSQLLLPGKRGFAFERIDKNGAESELTDLLNVKVEAATLRLWGRVIPIKYIIIAFLLICLILIAILIYLWRKIKKLKLLISLRVTGRGPLVKRIKETIDEQIPDKGLSAQEVMAIKTTLKKYLSEVERRLDASGGKNR